MSLFNEDQDKPPVITGPVYQIKDASKNPDFLDYVQNQRGFMEKISDQVGKIRGNLFKRANNTIERFKTAYRIFKIDKASYLLTLFVVCVFAVCLTLLISGSMAESNSSKITVVNGFPQVERVYFWWPNRQTVWMGDSYPEFKLFEIPIKTPEGPKFVVLKVRISLSKPNELAGQSVSRNQVIKTIHQQLSSRLQENWNNWVNERVYINGALENMLWGPNNSYDIDVIGVIDLYPYLLK